MTKSRKDQFLDDSAAFQARIQQRVERNASKLQSRIERLYTDADARDAEIYQLLGVSPDIVMSDYEAVAIWDRDPRWGNGLSSMLVASRMQAWIEILGTPDLFSVFANVAEELGSQAKSLTESELKDAAKEGVSKSRLAKARSALELVDSDVPIPKTGLPPKRTLPDIDVIKKMSNAELLDFLESHGVTKSYGQMQMDAGQYVTRMTDLRPGSPEWAAEVFRITDTESRRGMLGLTRRVQQNWTTLEYIDGDVDTQLIWVSEGDDHTCDNCARQAGQVKTYRQWQLEGMPGASTCLGGDYCRCDLVPF